MVEQQHILTLGLILFTASIVAMVCRRLRLPYSVGLVSAGIALAFMPVQLNLPLSRVCSLLDCFSSLRSYRR